MSNPASQLSSPTSSSSSSSTSGSGAALLSQVRGYLPSSLSDVGSKLGQAARSLAQASGITEAAGSEGSSTTDEGYTLDGFPRAEGVLWKTAQQVILGDQWYVFF